MADEPMDQQQPLGHNELSVAAPLLFYGLSRAPNNAENISPTKFLQELEARRGRFMWQDGATITYATSCFRGEADRFRQCLQIHQLNFGGPLHVTVNYPAFRTAFQEHYGVGGRTHRIDWSALFVQQSGTGLSVYLMNGMATIAQAIKESPDDLIGPPVTEAIDFETAVYNNADLAEVLPVTRRLVTANLELLLVPQRQQYRQRFATALSCFMYKQQLFMGINTQSIRRHALELCERHPDWTFLELTNKVLLFERQQRPGSKLAQIPKVEAIIDADDDDHDDNDSSHDEEGSVEAAKAKGKGKKKPKGKPAKIAPANGGPCTFCQGPRHTAAVCNKKRLAALGKAAAVADAFGRTGPTSGTMPPPQPPPQPQQQAAVNAHAMGNVSW